MAKTLQIEKLPKLPRRSVIYMIVCGGGVLLFCLIGILPNFKALSALDEDIMTLNRKINEQKILFPVFKKMLTHIEHPDTAVTSAAVRKKLKKDQIVSFTDQIKAFAETNGLAIDENKVDVRRFQEKGGFLEINFSMKGSLEEFRSFLVQIIELPYDIRIGRFEIQPITQNKRFQLSFWLALE